MATFKLITRELAERVVMPRARALRAEYRDYVRALEYGVAGRLVLEEDERPRVARAQLVAAARAEGVELTVHSRENVLTFWRKGESPLELITEE